MAKYDAPKVGLLQIWLVCSVSEEEGIENGRLRGYNVLAFDVE